MQSSQLFLNLNIYRYPGSFDHNRVTGSYEEILRRRRARERDTRCQWHSPPPTVAIPLPNGTASPLHQQLALFPDLDEQLEILVASAHELTDLPARSFLELDFAEAEIRVLAALNMNPMLRPDKSPLIRLSRRPS